MVYLKIVNKCFKRYIFFSPSLSLELRTLAAWGGIRTTRCGNSSECRGNQTLAGRFRFNMESSANNLWVLLSRSGSCPSRFPIETRAFNLEIIKDMMFNGYSEHFLIRRDTSNCEMGRRLLYLSYDLSLKWTWNPWIVHTCIMDSSIHGSVSFNKLSLKAW